jgi:alkanesulfonate monooxygenase SsuD/methylene tetrahydromethanopterin reductase-like flavin-dependent oxidoreductase (luciferase family)
MSAAFAHHMSPEIAVEALRDYRARFEPREPGATPYSAMSVLTFASEDEQAQLEFEAAWTLTMRNLARGVREPLRPEEVRELALSAGFRGGHRDLSSMVIGEPKQVAERLLELQAEAQVDEIVVVTPSLDRARRIASFEAVSEAWRHAA